MLSHKYCIVQKERQKEETRAASVRAKVNKMLWYSHSDLYFSHISKDIYGKIRRVFPGFPLTSFNKPSLLLMLFYYLFCLRTSTIAYICHCLIIIYLVIIKMLILFKISFKLCLSFLRYSLEYLKSVKTRVQICLSTWPVWLYMCLHGFPPDAAVFSHRWHADWVYIAPSCKCE